MKYGDRDKYPIESIVIGFNIGDIILKGFLFCLILIFSVIHYINKEKIKYYEQQLEKIKKKE